MAVARLLRTPPPGPPERQSDAAALLHELARAERRMEAQGRLRECPEPAQEPAAPEPRPRRPASAASAARHPRRPARQRRTRPASAVASAAPFRPQSARFRGRDAPGEAVVKQQQQKRKQQHTPSRSNALLSRLLQQNADVIRKAPAPTTARAAGALGGKRAGVVASSHVAQASFLRIAQHRRRRDLLVSDVDVSQYRVTDPVQAARCVAALNEHNEALSRVLQSAKHSVLSEIDAFLADNIPPKRDFFEVVRLAARAAREAAAAPETSAAEDGDGSPLSPRTPRTDGGSPRTPRVGSKDGGSPRSARVGSKEGGSPRTARVASKDGGSPRTVPVASKDGGSPRSARVASKDGGSPREPEMANPWGAAVARTLQAVR